MGLQPLPSSAKLRYKFSVSRYYYESMISVLSQVKANR